MATLLADAISVPYNTWSAQRAVQRPVHMILAPFYFEDPAPVVSESAEAGFHKLSWVVGGSELYATMVMLIRGLGF